MTIQKASPSDAGCWIDGHWGHYGAARLIEIASESGYDDYTEPNIVEIASRKLAAMSPSDAEDISLDEEEILSESMDEVEAWLNENVAPEGFSFGWSDGEFYLWADDEWQEATGEPCYVCGAAHGASLCGFCDLCSDYHRSDEPCKVVR